MKKITLLFITGIFISTFSFSQSPDWLWVQRAGEPPDDEGTMIATDASGNVFITGSFEGSSITFGSTTLMNAAGVGFFLVKYDASGNVLWAKTATGGIRHSHSIATDASGNVLMTGYFGSPSITFEATTLNCSNGYDIFLVKYDPNGNLVWARSSSGSSYIDEAQDVTTDGNGNIFVTGYSSSGSMDFGNSVTTPFGSSPHCFLVKYNPNGIAQWARASSGTTDERGWGVATDANGNVFATGNFTSPSVTFGSITLTNAGANTDDIFLVKYSTSGTVLWARSAGGTNNEKANDVSIDVNGNVLITGGFYSSSITFGTTTLTNGTSNQTSNMFLTKYDGSGNVLWARGGANSTSYSGSTVSTDIDGNTVVAGAYGVSQLVLGTFTLPCAGAADIFFVKYDANGILQWAKSIGAANAELCGGAAMDVNGNVFLTGSFQSLSVVIGSTTLTNASTTIHKDVLICKLNNCVTAPAAVIIANGATTVCSPNTVTLNVNAGVGLNYQWRLNGGDISGATSPSYAATLTGNYDCIVSNSCGNATSNVIAVTVNPGPAPGATITPAGPTTFCTGGNVVLNANTGSGFTYQWYNNDVLISGATSQSYTASAAGSYTVVVTSSQCSSSSNAVIVTVNPLPTAAITAGGPTTFCGPGSVTLNANTGTGLTYQWRKDGVNITGATGSSRTVNASGNYDCIVTNACGSSISNIITVTVLILPTTISASGPTTFCAPGSVTLTANSSSGLTYQWTKNSVNIPGATLFSYTATTTGTYTCYISNGYCLGNSNSITVTVQTAPTATITAAGPNTFCSPGSVTLNANTGAGLSYQWRLNSSPIVGATSSSYVASLAGNYDCIIANNCGSTTSNIITVTIDSAPSAVITAAGPTTFCGSGSVTLNANTGSGLSYQWRLNGANIAGETASSYVATAAGFFDCVVSNSCGSTASNIITVIIDVLPLADVTAAGPVSFCTPGSVTLNVSICSGCSYQWRQNTVNIPSANASSYVASVAGDYDCQVTNTCGTRTSNSITVIADVAPTASITAAGPTTFCTPGSVILNANTGPGLSYQWRLNGGDISGATSSSYNAVSTGNYDCVVSNTCGNVTSNMIAVTVNSTPSASITAAGPTTFCSPGSVTLNANTGQGLSYQWRLNGGNISGATLSSYSATSTGNYDCIVFNTCGNATSNTIAVTVNPAPAATITAAGPTTFCAPGSVVLNANTGTGLSYQWRLNGGDISGATASSFSATATGNYDCVVSNTCGGVASNTISVTVNPLPTAVITAAGSTNVCSPNTVTLNANTGPGLSYQWRLNTGNIAGATASSYNAGSSGNYDCVVTNSCGSVTSNTISVTVALTPATPGSITGQVTGACVSTLTYSISSVSGATGYTWTVPSGASVSNGQGSTSIDVAFTNSFSSGSISVAATNSCGTSGASSLSVTGPADQPGNISGPSSVCHNQNNVNYTINAVAGATSYTWTVPPGTQIKNGQGTTHIKVRFGNSAGNITVTANNPCGQSPAQILAIAMPCKEDITDSDFDVTLYPNPATDKLYVTCYMLYGNEKIKIFNAVGEIIQKSEIRNQESEIDTSSLPGGMYFAEITSGKQVKVLKFIKKE